MAPRRKLLRGLERIEATSEVLQRARREDPYRGMWEAADLQWWWRKPRTSDDVALPVWFDESGPIAAVCLTEWDDAWELDVICDSSMIDEDAVWDDAVTVVLAAQPGDLKMLLRASDTDQLERALARGFVITSEDEGTAWMHAHERPELRDVDGFHIVDRATHHDTEHWLVARNGALLERRLAQCSLYDASLDLAAQDANGAIAGYALFWHDSTTSVGLVEPVRVEDAFQRRGLASALLTHGLERLVARGATRLKIGFSSEAARHLYLGLGFTQTSVDLVLRHSRSAT